jgi:hypothetical protein
LRALFAHGGQVPGCKRGIRNMGYLEALEQPNCDIEWNGIEKITEDGILTKAGSSLFHALRIRDLN